MLTTCAEVLELLKSHANPAVTEARAKKFGIRAHNALGITHKTLGEILRHIKKSDLLGYQLFESGVYEARLLAAKILKPKNLEPDFMEVSVKTFDNWEICDSFAMGLFAKSPYAAAKAIEWSDREGQFERRAGFAIIAGLTLSHNKSPDAYFDPFFAQIKKHAGDDRLYVKKAISWALRSLGKRSPGLLAQARLCAESLIAEGSKSSLWIGKDALKEFAKA